MKILVATKNGQGQRANDFCHTTENEWVKFGMTCDRDRRDPDGGCGCGRAMLGMVSSKATTTFAVADLPVTVEQLKAELRASFVREGWAKLMPADEFDAMIAEDAGELIRIANLFEVGTVLEKRLEIISPRRVLPTVTCTQPTPRRRK